MQALGWVAQGVDPDPEVVALARQAGLSVDEGTLPEVELPENYFDAVTANHVIEHLHNPEATLEACYRILRPGGLLWIATPNLDAYGHGLFGSYWLHLDPPRHLVLFNFDSLNTLLKKVGFRVSSSPPATWTAERIFRHSLAIARGNDLFDDPPSSLPIGLRCKAHIANIQAWLDPKLSEELIMFAQKPK
jgi:SAM-dependent methyltransferase